MSEVIKALEKFRTLLQKNKRFRIIVIAFGLIVSILFASIFSFFMVRFESLGKITAAISIEPEKLDPTFCSDPETETVLVNLFEGLMRVDENGEAVKAAASDYTVSADGKTYTFTISPDAKWSDGTAVEASDFVYAWQRTANPYNASAYSYMFENIAGYDKVLEDFEKEQRKETDAEGNYIVMQMSDLAVKAKDSRTLVVTLKEKDSSFLHKCARAAFFPLCEDKVRPYTRIWSTDPELFVSNGAFVLSAWTGGKYVELTKNEHFRNKDNVEVKTLKFFFVSDGKEAVKMFDDSDVLFTDVLPENNLEKTAKKRQYNSYENLGTYFLYFNLAEHPFDDARVRKALTLAIDRQELVKKTASARGVPASALISDGFSSFRQAGEDFFSTTDNEENIKKAKQLLKEAGYENGKGFPKFEYLYNDNIFNKETAEILQQMWKDNLGINCTLKSVSWSKLDELRNHGNFTVAKGGLLAPYNDVGFMLNNFTSENNSGGFNDEQYDKLVKNVMNSQGENKISYARKAEKILMDNWVICPLYYYADGYLASGRVDGLYVTNYGIAYFMYADVNVF